MVCWTIVRVLTRYGSVAQLRKPAQLLLALLMVQLGLGFAAYLTASAVEMDAPQPIDRHGGQHRVARRVRRAGAGDQRGARYSDRAA